MSRFRAFDKNHFWHFHAGELAADILLLLYSLVFSKYLFNDVQIFRTGSPLLLISLYMIIMMIVPWYMGFILVRFEEYYKSKRVNRIVTSIIVVSGLFVIVYLFVILFHLFDFENGFDRLTNTITMFSVFLAILGPMMGIGGAMTSRELLTDGKAGESGNFLFAMFTITLSCFFLVYWGFSFEGSDIDNEFLEFLAITGIFIGSCFAAVIVTALLMGLLNGIRKLIEMMNFNRTSLAIADALFPVLIISALVTWNEFGLHYLKMVVGRDAGFLTLLASLTITGFLPFRLILLFTPPLKAINLIIGLVALTAYLISLS